MTNTLERLRAIMVRDYQLAPERLTTDARLDNLGLDSLGVAELLFMVEDEFTICLPTDPIHLTTMGAVVRHIDEIVWAQHGRVAAPDIGLHSTSPMA